jgi:hypothetical protein
MKFYIWFFSQICRKFQFSLKSDKNNGYFIWRPKYTMIISHSVLRISILSDKNYRENQNSYFMITTYFFSLKSCHLWDNVEKYGRAGQATYANMGACALHAGYLALQTHSSHAVYIALPLPQWLQERASMLRYMYIGCLVVYKAEPTCCN